MGHLIAAAGAVEAAICALAIHHALAPVNANLAVADPECDLDIVRGGARVKRIRVALSNSFGFGGSNSCLVFRNPEEVPVETAEAPPIFGAPGGARREKRPAGLRQRRRPAGLGQGWRTDD
jgi:acyl transferase domain-containing protein